MQKRRNASGIIGGILFLGSLLLSTPAHSKEYYYFCMVFDATEKELYYYSDILVTDVWIDDREIIRPFNEENERRSIRDYGHVPTTGFCQLEYTLSEAQKWYHRKLEQYSHTGLKYPFTRPPVPSKPVVSNVSPVPVIIVEEAQSVTPTPEQLAEQAAIEREAAANRARMASASARNDAKVQAAIAEQLRLRKLQGSRQ